MSSTGGLSATYLVGLGPIIDEDSALIFKNPRK